MSRWTISLYIGTILVSSVNMLARMQGLNWRCWALGITHTSVVHVLQMLNLTCGWSHWIKPGHEHFNSYTVAQNSPHLVTLIWHIGWNHTVDPVFKDHPIRPGRDGQDRSPWWSPDLKLLSFCWEYVVSRGVLTQVQYNTASSCLQVLGWHATPLYVQH